MSNCDVGPGVFYVYQEVQETKLQFHNFADYPNLFEGSTVSKARALQNHHLSCGCHECNLMKCVTSWILAFLSPFMVTATNHATMTFRQLQIYTAAEFLQVKKLQIKTWGVDTDRKQQLRCPMNFKTPQRLEPRSWQARTRMMFEISYFPGARKVGGTDQRIIPWAQWQASPITVQGKKHGRPSAQRTFWKSQTQKIWTGLTLPTCNIQRRSSPVAPGCTLGQSIHPHFKGWQIMSNQ